MAIVVRGIRDTFMQWVGAAAASLALLGVNTSNNRFNGRRVRRYYCSELLHDEMIIRRFYVYETLIRHNFVVFQTDTKHTFKVHLIADVYPRSSYSPIYVEISPTYWRPEERDVWTSKKKAKKLKRFVQRELQKFGPYEVGINDCRHFARTVADFLAS